MYFSFHGLLFGRKRDVTAPRQEPLDALARIYADQLLEQTGEEPFPTAKIIDLLLSDCPQTPEAFPPDEALAARLAPLEAAIGPIGSKLEAVAAQYAAFLAKFDAKAEDGKLDKAKGVVLATESILEVRGAPSPRAHHPVNWPGRTEISCSPPCGQPAPPFTDVTLPNVALLGRPPRSTQLFESNVSADAVQKLLQPPLSMINTSLGRHAPFRSESAMAAPMGALPPLAVANICDIPPPPFFFTRVFSSLRFLPVFFFLRVPSPTPLSHA